MPAIPASVVLNVTNPNGSTRTLTAIQQEGDKVLFRDKALGSALVSQTTLEMKGSVTKTGTVVASMSVKQPDYAITSADIAAGVQPVYGKVEVRVTLPANMPVAEMDVLKNTVIQAMSNATLGAALFNGDLLF